jgi:hypothetical protein
MSRGVLEPTKARLEVVITPFEVEVEDCIVTIYEVSIIPAPQVPEGKLYWASCQIHCRVGDKTVSTIVFPITFRNSDDLRSKLKVEVSKFKYNLFLYGKDELKRRGLAI